MISVSAYSSSPKGITVMATRGHFIITATLHHIQGKGCSKHYANQKPHIPPLLYMVSSLSSLQNPLSMIMRNRFASTRPSPSMLSSIVLTSWMLPGMILKNSLSSEYTSDIFAFFWHCNYVIIVIIVWLFIIDIFNVNVYIIPDCFRWDLFHKIYIFLITLTYLPSL